MLASFFKPPVFPGNELKTLRARVLFVTLNYVMLVFSIVIVTDLFDGEIPAATIAIDISAVLIFAAARWALNRGWIEPMGAAIVGVGFVLISLAIYSLGTIRTPTTSFYMVSIILAGILFRRRGMLILVGASSLMTAVFIWGERAGWMRPTFTNVTITQWVTFSLAFLLVGLMVLMVEGVTKDAVARANHELVERQRAIEAMLSSETKFRSLVEQSLDGISIANQNGDVVVWNRALEAITGQHADDVIGKPAWDVQFSAVTPERRSPERYEQLKALMKSSLKSGGHLGPGEPVEIAIMTPNGARKTVETITYVMKVQDEYWLASILRDTTERKRAEQRLRESEERFHRLFEGHDAVMLLVDPESGQIIDANLAASKFYGYSVDALRLMKIYEINMLPLQEQIRNRQLALAGDQNAFIFQHRLANGEIRWVEAHSSPLMVQGKRLLFSIYHDVTDRQVTADALKETEQRLRLTLEVSHLVAWEIEPETGRMHDIGPVHELFDRPESYEHSCMDEWLEMIHPDDRERVMTALRSAVENSSEYNVEYRLAQPEGNPRWIEATGRRVDGPSGRPARLLGAAKDISERKWAEQALNELNEQLLEQIWEIEQLQKALREQVIRDPLSGLYNRWYLDEALAQEFARSRRECYPISLIMMDIDHFKDLNDTYGHLVGDQIISMISGRLRSACRDGDVVCRFGGEEFVVMLRNVDQETAIDRAEQCREAVQIHTFDVDSLELKVTLSAGVATYPLHVDSAVDLIRAADTALYQAKAQGRNCVVKYLPEVGAART